MESMIRSRRRRIFDENRKASIVQEAFDSYLDMVVDSLQELGISSDIAIESIFSTAEYLAENSVLPQFPEGDVHYRVMGTWLIAAVDFDFADFMMQAVKA